MCYTIYILMKAHFGYLLVKSCSLKYTHSFQTNLRNKMNRHTVILITVNLLMTKMRDMFDYLVQLLVISNAEIFVRLPVYIVCDKSTTKEC